MPILLKHVLYHEPCYFHFLWSIEVIQKLIWGRHHQGRRVERVPGSMLCDHLHVVERHLLALHGISRRGFTKEGSWVRFPPQHLGKYNHQMGLPNHTIRVHSLIIGEGDFLQHFISNGSPSGRIGIDILHITF